MAGITLSRFGRGGFQIDDPHKQEDSEDEQTFRGKCNLKETKMNEARTRQEECNAVWSQVAKDFNHINAIQKSMILPLGHINGNEIKGYLLAIKNAVTRLEQSIRDAQECDRKWSVSASEAVNEYLRSIK